MTPVKKTTISSNNQASATLAFKRSRWQNKYIIVRLPLSIDCQIILGNDGTQKDCESSQYPPPPKNPLD